MSLADTESLHGAEGESVAPLDYLCRNTTDEDEQSGSKTGKDKKQTYLLIEKLGNWKKKSFLLVLVSVSASLF